MEKKPQNNAHILHDPAYRETRNIEPPTPHFIPTDFALTNKKTGKVKVPKLKPKDRQ